MTYYLKKHWQINLLVTILQIAFAAAAVMTNVVMIQMFQSVIDRQVGDFWLWMAVLGGTWGAYLLLDYFRARALIHDRSILLVDEGTSALDQKNADIVEESLLKNKDLTLILVSHHLTDERKKQFTKVYSFA